MHFCRACRRLSPAGSAYCPGCGGSFGGSRCDKGHLTPGAAPVRSCSVCGSRSIVAATPSADLGCVPRLLAWALAVLGLRWCLSNPGPLLELAGSALGWLFGTAVPQRFGAIVSLLLTLKVFSWCVGMISPETAARIDPVPKVLPWMFAAVRKGVPAVLRLMRFLVEGTPAKKESRKRTQKEGE